MDLRPPPARSALRLALLALTLALLGVAPAAALAGSSTTYPSDGTFDANAGGWTQSGSCALLCSMTSTWDNTAGVGTPLGSLKSTFSAAVSVLGSGTATWRSPTFAWAPATPTSATFSVQRAATVAGLLGVGGAASWSASLVDETAGTTTSLVSEPLTTAMPFSLKSVSVTPSLLVQGHSYHLELATSMSVVLAAVSAAAVSFDQVALTGYVPSPPTIASASATPSSAGAGVSVQADGKGLSGTAWLEWGTTASLGQTTATIPVAAQSGNQTLALSLTGLNASTTYQYRVHVLTTDGEAITATQSFTTGAPTLGIALSGAVGLSALAPGQTSTGSGTVTVVSTGAWVLRVSDGGTSHPGHLLRTSGTTGADFLAAALGWSTSPLLGGTGGSGTLSGTPAVAATGALANVVTVTYSQPVGASEQLAFGAGYGLTTTWTVSAT
jgi:hypothetical protein